MLALGEWGGELERVRGTIEGVSDDAATGAMSLGRLGGPRT